MGVAPLARLKIRIGRALGVAALVFLALCARPLASAAHEPDISYETWLKMLEGPPWWNAWKKLPGATLAWRCAEASGRQFQIDFSAPERATARAFFAFIEQRCAGPFAAFKTLPARELEAALTQLETSALVSNLWTSRQRQLAATPLPVAGALFDAGTRVGVAAASPHPFAPAEGVLGVMNTWPSDNFAVWFFGRSGAVAYAAQAERYEPSPDMANWGPRKEKAQTFSAQVWLGEPSLSALEGKLQAIEVYCTTEEGGQCEIDALPPAYPAPGERATVVRKPLANGALQTCYAAKAPKPALKCEADAKGDIALKELAPSALNSEVISVAVALSDHFMALLRQPNWLTELTALDAHLRQAMNHKAAQGRVAVTGNEAIECILWRARAAGITDTDKELRSPLRGLTCDGRDPNPYFQDEQLALMRAEAMRLLRLDRTFSEPSPWEFDLQGRGERDTTVNGKPGRAFDGEHGYAYAIDGTTIVGVLPALARGFRKIKEPVPPLTFECRNDRHRLRCVMRVPLIETTSFGDEHVVYKRDGLVATFDPGSAGAPIKLCVEREGKTEHKVKMAPQGKFGELQKPGADGCFTLAPDDRDLSRLAWQRIFDVGDPEHPLVQVGDVQVQSIDINYAERVPNFIRFLAAKLESRR